MDKLVNLQTVLFVFMNKLWHIGSQFEGYRVSSFENFGTQLSSTYLVQTRSKINLETQ